MTGTTNLPEKLEVLHIPGSDLNHIYIFNSCLKGGSADDFADCGKSGLLAGFFHVAEAFLLKTLEGVGGSAGLVGAAAENRSTGFSQLWRWS